MSKMYLTKMKNSKKYYGEIHSIKDHVIWRWNKKNDSILMGTVTLLLSLIVLEHRLLIHWDEKKKSSRIPPALLLSPDRADIDCGIDRLSSEI